MTPEFWIALATVATLVGGLIVWLLITGSSVGKALVELGICKSDVAKLQTETQTLRDQSVRSDERMASINAQLERTNVQLSKIDALIASVAALTAIVERLERDRRD
jgi:septal ring factor EnvC (AmiA/AmiB activator)